MAYTEVHELDSTASAAKVFVDRAGYGDWTRAARLAAGQGDRYEFTVVEVEPAF